MCRPHDELCSMLLCLHSLTRGQISAGSGPHVQAAFLDIVRQADPALAARLHEPNLRRPYTLGLFKDTAAAPCPPRGHLIYGQQAFEIKPGQICWLRITTLDYSVFSSFVPYLMALGTTPQVRIGQLYFAISHLLLTPVAQPEALAGWTARSSFAELATLEPARRRYCFHFASPTAFSRGQKAWGKLLKLFPEPADVFESLGRQWENFAPTELSLSAAGLSPHCIATWCEDNLSISQYHLETCHLSAHKFGLPGFQGTITYEVKGQLDATQACWLTTLARFALFSGAGYKTTMGMGQTRCIDLPAYIALE
ncbi:CRISPR system precrRNA processing endoribonuclease RAMP protein Cas6 [Ktedonosporobacter rubrisoli]|uniref:CRISPR system precrRNA processing endoribonuclease RAMP protein Cas6 n=1 Tax=Ktedonosporobacter rubrisoli TaxID=2509675 RepID=A0A4P6JZ48_KTERU|nr:CRISPR system precrRNA processing endoribonuclease RAMP protein Cas6 [Ktedonosporobacter rubrisoli]QBD80772.1 CRISPR system precrRNA processing endoribonuclease RAMP protein Cas6 [Ktedonosporobacter rubrisoli]